MATTGLGGFLTRVRHTLAADDRTDADLLRTFADTRSDPAFAELVRRFAPMVWGVCRRTVGHHQHAEDAFQAVFLVLARKPAAVRPPAAVGGWLHAVAVHTSRRARAMADRRRRWETDTRTPPEPFVADELPPTDPAALRALDEAIARLPDKLRTAVVLCELNGLSRREAAVRLGIPEGTLSSRLAAARKELAERLRLRGVTLGVFALLSAATATAVPPVQSVVSQTAATLAEGVIRAMFLKKLTLAGLVAVLAGVVLLALPAWAGEPTVPHVRRNAPPPKLAPKEGRILLWLDDKPQLLKPDGTELESPLPMKDVYMGVGWGNARLSPDGKRVAFHRQGKAANMPVPKNRPAGVAFATNRTLLNVLDLDGDRTVTELDSVNLNEAFWMGDGRRLYVRGQEINDGVVSETAESWEYDVVTGKRTLLKVPEPFVVRSVGPDGKTAVVDEWKHSADTWHQRAHVWTIGGTDKPTPLLDLNHSFDNQRPQFSPDGKKLLCKVSHYGKITPQGNGAWTLDDFKFNNLLVIDLATKKQTVVKEYGEDPEWRMAGFAWSPDGKRIAYAEWKRIQPAPGARSQNPVRVMVADADGQNAKEVYTANGSWLMGFDWK